jgi:hypothetical protein
MLLALSGSGNTDDANFSGGADGRTETSFSTHPIGRRLVLAPGHQERRWARDEAEKDARETLGIKAEEDR